MKELNTSCSKHTVIVNKEWLNDNMVTNFTIFGPPRIHVDVVAPASVLLQKSTSCNHDPPSGDHFQQQEAALESPAQYRRCCVPVEYYPVEFLGLESDGSWKKEEIPNATVKECGCIYQKKYQIA